MSYHRPCWVSCIGPFRLRDLHFLCTNKKRGGNEALHGGSSGIVVIHHSHLLVTKTFLSYGASTELIDRSWGRAETTSHTTHWECEATTLRITSRTYLLLVNRG